MVQDFLNFTTASFKKTVQTNGMKQKHLIISKLSVAASAFGGVLLGLFDAQQAGYSHWSRRLLYFTAQSNLCLGAVNVMLLVILLRGKQNPQKWYFLKYIFTVSIVLTGLVFCLILAPFADQSYHPWSLSNILTHAVTPLLALLDFALDRYPVAVGKRGALLTLIPPLGYFLLASLLELFGVDFGRGEPYPYFFMNYRSPVGIFGVGGTRPFVMGAFYWILLFLLTVLLVAELLARYHVRHSQKR